VADPGRTTPERLGEHRLVVPRNTPSCAFQEGVAAAEEEEDVLLKLLLLQLKKNDIQCCHRISMHQVYSAIWCTPLVSTVQVLARWRLVRRRDRKDEVGGLKEVSLATLSYPTRLNSPFSHAVAKVAGRRC
jgi:hypothetical protein